MKIKPFMLGMWEFRRMLTSDPGEEHRMAYEWGREWAHKLTRHHYDYKRPDLITAAESIARQTVVLALEMNAGLIEGIAPNRIAQIARQQNQSTEKVLLDVLDLVVEHRRKEAAKADKP